MDEYYRAVQVLPFWLARPLMELPAERAERIHEIRLRIGCPPVFTVDGETRTCEELVSDKGSALAALRLTDLQMEEIFYTLCGGSVHSHQNEIAAGYITLV